MKAVLAGFSGEKKLYYILDAESRENDGAVVTPDGKVIRVSFFGFAMNARKLKRLTKTAFHRFLWNEPDGEIKKIWTDTFLLKTRPISKRFTEGLVIHSNLGGKPKKQKSIDIKVKSFLDKSSNSFSTLSTKNINNGEQNGI